LRALYLVIIRCGFAGAYCAIVDQASSSLRRKRVDDFMRRDAVVLRSTDSILTAMKAFKKAGTLILPLMG
jgi:predicted transcriptional regulator